LKLYNTEKIRGKVYRECQDTVEIEIVDMEVVGVTEIEEAETVVEEGLVAETDLAEDVEVAAEEGLETEEVTEVVVEDTEEEAV